MCISVESVIVTFGKEEIKKIIFFQASFMIPESFQKDAMMLQDSKELNPLKTVLLKLNSQPKLTWHDFYMQCSEP